MADGVVLLAEAKAEDREVTLEIPPSGDAVTLQTVLAQVRTKLDARTVKIIGSWAGTAVTLRVPASVTPTNVIDELLKVRRVREARENGNGKKGTITLLLGEPG